MKRTLIKRKRKSPKGQEFLLLPSIDLRFLCGRVFRMVRSKLFISFEFELLCDLIDFQTFSKGWLDKIINRLSRKSETKATLSCRHDVPPLKKDTGKSITCTTQSIFFMRLVSRDKQGVDIISHLIEVCFHLLR